MQNCIYHHEAKNSGMLSQSLEAYTMGPLKQPSKYNTAISHLLHQLPTSHPINNAVVEAFSKVHGVLYSLSRSDEEQEKKAFLFKLDATLKKSNETNIAFVGASRTYLADWEQIYELGVKRRIGYLSFILLSDMLLVISYLSGGNNTEFTLQRVFSLSSLSVLDLLPDAGEDFIKYIKIGY